MIRIDKIPIIIWLTFQVIYYCIAGKSDAWNGTWFCFNCFILTWFFAREKNYIIKSIGVALNISVAMFCIARFFYGFTGERMYTLIPFSIILTGLICLQVKRK